MSAILLREYSDILNEIDLNRRGFLKGMGAAAGVGVAGTAAYQMGKSKPVELMPAEPVDNLQQSLELLQTTITNNINRELATSASFMKDILVGSPQLGIKGLLACCGINSTVANMIGWGAANFLTGSTNIDNIDDFVVKLFKYAEASRHDLGISVEEAKTLAHQIVANTYFKKFDTASAVMLTHLILDMANKKVQQQQLDITLDSSQILLMFQNGMPYNEILSKILKG